MKFSSFKKDQLLMESWRGFLKEDDETEEYQRLKAKTMDGNLSPDENKRFLELARKLDPSSWPTAPEGTESEDPWPDYDAGEMAARYYPSQESVYSKEGDPDKLDDTRAEIANRAKLEKALEDKLAAMPDDEIEKISARAEELLQQKDFPWADVGNVSGKQLIKSVIWAMLNPEEAKGDAPKSTLGVGPPNGSGF